MNRNPVLLYKTLVVGVIVLFIGVGIQPAFATVQPEVVDTEYFDVTTEFVGFNSNYTIQLTKEQIQELDALFDSFRNSLNNSESYEDTVEIYNNMILKLNSYGLLGDCNVKQIQELVTGRFQKPIYEHLMNRLYDRIPINNNTNVNCQIAGRSNTTLILPPSAMIVDKLLDTISQYLPIPLILFLWAFTSFRPVLILPLTFILGGGITYGASEDYTYKPAEGWINTDGLYGQKDWEGCFYGGIEKYQWGLTLLCIGVIGFKGIIIGIGYSITKHPFYLGSANYVNIVHESPL